MGNAFSLGGGPGNGGTSNQTNAAFQIGRARRNIEQSIATPFDDRSQTNMAQYSRRVRGAKRSLEALEDWQDNPFGPTLRKEVAEDRLQDREQMSRFGRVGIGRWNMESRKDRELNRVQGIGPRK